MDDPIKNLLSSTGWSCEELLKKIQLYKTLQHVEDLQENTVTVSNAQENECVVDSTGENIIENNCAITGTDIDKNQRLISNLVNEQSLESNSDCFPTQSTSSTSEAEVNFVEVVERDESSGDESSQESSSSSISEEDTNSLNDVQVNSTDHKSSDKSLENCSPIDKDSAKPGYSNLNKEKSGIQEKSNKKAFENLDVIDLSSEEELLDKTSNTDLLQKQTTIKQSLKPLDVIDLSSEDENPKKSILNLNKNDKKIKSDKKSSYLKKGHSLKKQTIQDVIDLSSEDENPHELILYLNQEDSKLESDEESNSLKNIHEYLKTYNATTDEKNKKIEPDKKIIYLKKEKQTRIRESLKTFDATDVSSEERKLEEPILNSNENDSENSLKKDIASEKQTTIKDSPKTLDAIDLSSEERDAEEPVLNSNKNDSKKESDAESNSLMKDIASEKQTTIQDSPKTLDAIDLSSDERNAEESFLNSNENDSEIESDDESNSLNKDIALGKQTTIQDSSKTLDIIDLSSEEINTEEPVLNSNETDSEIESNSLKKDIALEKQDSSKTLDAIDLSCDERKAEGPVLNSNEKGSKIEYLEKLISLNRENALEKQTAIQESLKTLDANDLSSEDKNPKHPILISNEKDNKTESDKELISLKKDHVLEIQTTILVSPKTFDEERNPEEPVLNSNENNNKKESDEASFLLKEDNPSEKQRTIQDSPKTFGDIIVSSEETNPDKPVLNSNENNSKKDIALEKQTIQDSPKTFDDNNLSEERHSEGPVSNSNKKDGKIEPDEELFSLNKDNALDKQTTIQESLKTLDAIVIFSEERNHEEPVLNSYEKDSEIKSDEELTSSKKDNALEKETTIQESLKTSDAINEEKKTEDPVLNLNKKDSNIDSDGQDLVKKRITVKTFACIDAFSKNIKKKNPIKKSLKTVQYIDLTSEDENIKDRETKFDEKSNSDKEKAFKESLKSLEYEDISSEEENYDEPLLNVSVKNEKIESNEKSKTIEESLHTIEYEDVSSEDENYEETALSASETDTKIKSEEILNTKKVNTDTLVLEKQKTIQKSLKTFEDETSIKPVLNANKKDIKIESNFAKKDQVNTELLVLERQKNINESLKTSERIDVSLEEGNLKEPVLKDPKIESDKKSNFTKNDQVNSKPLVLEKQKTMKTFEDIDMSSENGNPKEPIINSNKQDEKMESNGQKEDQLIDDRSVLENQKIIKESPKTFEVIDVSFKDKNPKEPVLNDSKMDKNIESDKKANSTKEDQVNTNLLVLEKQKTSKESSNSFDGIDVSFEDGFPKEPVLILNKQDRNIEIDEESNSVEKDQGSIETFNDESSDIDESLLNLNEFNWRTKSISLNKFSQSSDSLKNSIVSLKVSDDINKSNCERPLKPLLNLFENDGKIKPYEGTNSVKTVEKNVEILEKQKTNNKEMLNLFNSKGEFSEDEDSFEPLLSLNEKYWKATSDEDSNSSTEVPEKLKNQKISKELVQTFDPLRNFFEVRSKSDEVLESAKEIEAATDHDYLENQIANKESINETSNDENSGEILLNENDLGKKIEGLLVNTGNLQKDETSKESEKTLDLIGEFCESENSEKSVSKLDGETLQENTEMSKTCDTNIDNLLVQPEDLSIIDTCDKNKENANTLDSTDQKNDGVEKPSENAIEEIRNNLKLQLSCLRNRKKSQFLEKLPEKKDLIVPELNVVAEQEIIVESDEVENVEKEHTSLKNKDLDVSKESTSSNSADVEKNILIDLKSTSQIMNKEVEDSDLYSQTNEFGIVILDVQGGVDIAEDSERTADNLQSNEEVEFYTSIQEKEDAEDTSKNIKSALSALRKIIRKQKEPVATTSKCGNLENSNSNKLESEQSKNLGESNENSLTDFPNSEEISQRQKSLSDKSPFLSNSLDEFLTENSKLNISYNVPKSGAEVGLKETYRDSSPNSRIQKETKIQVIEEKPKKFQEIKAKTLAEKRKLLQKSGIITCNKFKENKVKKQQLSYVMYNNKKIWVHSLAKSGCLTKITDLKTYCSPINFKKPASKPTKSTKPKVSRKPSLLSHLGNKASTKIRYKPGPLSKKMDLQFKETKNNWQTKIVKLPTIVLQIIPEINKPIHPNILHLLPPTPLEITENQADFALSMLKEKKPCPKIFNFPINYSNNQKKMLVRKRKLIEEKLEQKEPLPAKEPKEEIEGIIDALISYVEIKEIAESLIKEDADVEQKQEEEKVVPKISPIKKIKRRKVNLELLRLSCKVINVDVDENTKDEVCNKPFCKLGCVCNSLKCSSVCSYHCKRIECMFNCSCPKDESLIFDEHIPSDSNVLSTDTINRLQAQAKRNLAKVEKEFTQTVIQSNNTTIVVGGKLRRATKAPKKYTDYVETFVANEIVETKPEFAEPECVVSLARLRIPDIIPYCLIHRAYDCYCQSKAFTSTKHKLEVDSSTKKIIPLKKMKFKKQKKFVEDKSLIFKSNGCSRCSVTATKVIQRNKDARYFVGLLKKINKMQQSQDKLMELLNESSGKDTDADILKQQILSESQLTGADILRRELSPNKSQSQIIEILDEKLPDSRTTHKRKQSFDVRSDDFTNVNNKRLKEDKELAMQRRMKKNTANGESMKAIFEGEIMIDKRNFELLKRMGSRTVADGFARLLPFKCLVKNFQEKKIKIWCMADEPSRLLINTSDKHPPKNYVDILVAKEKSDIISWIRSGKLPERYNKEGLSFILKPTKNHYEICGICTKTSNDLMNTSLNLTSNSNEDDSDFFTHTNVQNIKEILNLSKEYFPPVDLIGDYSDAFIENVFNVNLPDITNVCRWRVLNMKMRFSFLYFENTNYSIKYPNLRKVLQIADESNQTAILRSTKFSEQYNHLAFGIYCTPTYQDYIFIGPYFKQEEHKIKTFLCFEGLNIPSKHLNKVKIINSSCWLVQDKYSTALPSWKPSNSNNIDLTEENLSDLAKNKVAISGQSLLRKNYVDFGTPVHSNPSVKITPNSDKVIVLESTPKNPEDFNRYIVTNIPHFGYLGAMQHPKETSIDVSWPLENKVLRFSSVKHARDFLQKRFASLLQPIPEDFQINVIVMTDINLEETQPIDAQCLNGHYICGEFGIFNAKSITDEFSQNTLGITKEELERVFAKRAQSFVRTKVEEFASLLNFNNGDLKNFRTAEIINMATTEIKELEKEIRAQIVIKTQLIATNKKCAHKVFQMLSDLPIKEKFWQSKIFRSIIDLNNKNSVLEVAKKLPNSPRIEETIEIIDDSDPEEPETTIEKITPKPIIPAKKIFPPFIIEKSNHNNKVIISKNISLLKVRPPQKLQSVLKPSLLRSQNIHTVNTSNFKSTTSLTNNTLLIKNSASLLKVSDLPSSSNNQEQLQATPAPLPPLLTGLKVIKTTTGQLLLVKSDKRQSVVIKNNKIVSVTKSAPVPVTLPDEQ